MSEQSASGLHFVRYAASGRNRFVTGIALLAALGGFLFGYDTGIIGQALPYLSKDLHPSTLESSWIVAVLLIGAMIGAGISGYLSEAISRKWTKCISGCVYVIGALAAAFAQDIIWLVAARFVLGLSVGTASFVAPEYIAEQTPPKIRGGTVTFNQLMVTLGILLAYVTGYGLRDVGYNWRWMFGIAVIPGAALAISMVFVPHSPRWLVKKGRVDEAREVLEQTRAEDADIDGELQQIQDVSEAEQGWSIADLFRTKVRALMVVGIGLAVFQQFVGVNTVIYFASTIIGYVGFATNQAVLLAVMVGVTNFVFTIVAILLMDWVGRRKLLIVGTAILLVALAVLGAYFQFHFISQNASWIGIACVIVYIIGFAIGLGPVFWLMISEIYPLAFRSQAMAIATICNWAANFLVSFYFLQETKAIGRGPTFWIYAAIAIAAIAFFWVKVPETKNRPLEDIEREIGGEELAQATSGGSGGSDGSGSGGSDGSGSGGSSGSA
ncbi:MAG TPA: sugar porter family MFS transporter [Segeticoccus sp.]|uniref:sugar porter family MFS transporter n=1 Tax=Segeticoccus sp. TaxID=2706531 RepID=UPI002D7E7D81|nr:sugar porter family MFS transporter [Segeticoccus sp.]HET8600157.1 sugar porter family MFS transporter [Segeticoccus sp.]